MKFAIFFLAAVILGAARTAITQNVPIPKRPPRGFVYNASSCTAPVELKVFVDLICSDCKAAWPTLLKVAEIYNKASPLVSLNTLIFPLPFHRAAMTAAQISYVLKRVAPGKTYTWFTYMFNNQAKYDNSAIFSLTQAEVQRMFVDDVFVATGIRQNDTLSHLAEHGAASTTDAIGMWKYGCSRTVSGTSTAFLNDVRIDFDTNWTLEDWRRVIDPLLEIEE